MKILIKPRQIEGEGAFGLFMGFVYATPIYVGLMRVNLIYAVLREEELIVGLDPTVYLLACTLGILGAVLMFTLTYEILVRNFDISPKLYLVGLFFNLVGVGIISSSVVILPLNTMFLWLLFVMYSECVLRIARKLGFKFEISRREFRPWASSKEKWNTIIKEIIAFLLLLLVTYLVIYNCYDTFLFYSHHPNWI